MVIDVDLFQDGAWSPGVAERTLTHEGFHVALHQRAESVIEPGQEQIRTAEDFYFVAAAIACEEFRVESAVGREMRPGQYDGFPSAS